MTQDQPGRYCGGITAPDHDTVADETQAMLDAAGITVTDAGRARAKLREMDERMTPEAWERRRAKYRPTRAA
jgi:hypothetical protein